jgi:uncharacterized protein YdiU (UPF0061 family)
VRPEDETLTSELLEALAESETDFTLFFRRLADVRLTGSHTELLEPLRAAFYDEQATHERLVAWLRRYGTRVATQSEPVEARRSRMNAVNPKFVFRNYLAQQAIDAMEAGDGTVLERLMAVLQRPYDEQPAFEEYAARRPEWARHKAGCSALSCSS